MHTTMEPMNGYSALFTTACVPISSLPLDFFRWGPFRVILNTRVQLGRPQDHAPPTGTGHTQERAGLTLGDSAPSKRALLLLSWIPSLGISQSESITIQILAEGAFWSVIQSRQFTFFSFDYRCWWFKKKKKKEEVELLRLGVGGGMNK